MDGICSSCSKCDLYQQKKGEATNDDISARILGLFGFDGLCWTSTCYVYVSNVHRICVSVLCVHLIHEHLICIKYAHNIFAHAYVYIHMWICRIMFIYTYTYTYTYSYIHIYTYIYTYFFVYLHIYT